MKLVSAVLARNEAGKDRYLARVLQCCQEFSDAVLLLDDHSTDATAEVAEKLGCLVKKRAANQYPAWGHETPARVELWQWGVEVGRTLAATPHTSAWLLICDADMLLHGDSATIRALCYSWDAAACAWPLADLWESETTYRMDGPWGVGCNTPRPWLFRVTGWPEDYTPAWSGRGIHSGHAPANFAQVGPCLVAPPDIFWKHLGWLKRSHREAKAEQYAKVSKQMSEFERAHCATILDK